MKKYITILLILFNVFNVLPIEKYKLDSVNFKNYNKIYEKCADLNKWIGWQKCENHFSIEFDNDNKKIDLYTNTKITYKYLYSTSNIIDKYNTVSYYSTDNDNDIIITIYYMENIKKKINILYLFHNFEVSYIIK